MGTNMKKIVLSMILISQLFIAANADYVGGYVRQNGTVVRPYARTSPDGATYNNYSTLGNTNPYTGQAGTVSAFQNRTYYNPYNQQRMPALNGVTMPLAGGSNR